MGLLELVCNHTLLRVIQASLLELHLTLEMQRNHSLYETVCKM